MGAADVEVLLVVELLEAVAFEVGDNEVAPIDPESSEMLGDNEADEDDSLAAAILLETIVIDPLRLLLVIEESTAMLVSVNWLDGTTLVAKSVR